MTTPIDLVCAMPMQPASAKASHVYEARTYCLQRALSRGIQGHGGL
jgi:hypothetical protein